jgi:hypothetical protein
VLELGEELESERRQELVWKERQQYSMNQQVLAWAAKLSALQWQNVMSCAHL